MVKHIIHSFFLALFSVSAFAQEGVKPLRSNINYLYGDLKPFADKQNNSTNYNRAVSLSLPFSDDFSYSTTQAYPNQNLWSDSSTYVNSGFAIAPWSIGVATFDGLNRRGYPYTPNLVNMSSSLPADTLTSKPINLNLRVPSDSIALTFYYQARGNGDTPELSDTLLLDYWKPKQATWSTKVWYQRGNSNPNTNDTVFKRGFVWVSDTAYLHDGFKFRFRNKATTAGDFDHWHLDYVYMNINRGMIKDTTNIDFAFGYIPTPYLKNYSAMPWRQYDTNDMVAKNSVFIRNNGITGSQLTYTANFRNGSNTFVHGYTSGAVNVTGIFKYKGWLKDTVVSNPRLKYKFPFLTSAVGYKIQHILFKTTVDDIQRNDTVIQQQNFSNYYAFDDGSAEGGYYINGAGGKIAAKYTTRVTDTLKSVRIYFEPAGSLNLSQTYGFDIAIWQAGQSGPSTNTVYVDPVTKYVNYFPNGEFNKFSEFQLTTPLILPPGNYFIGFQQKVATGIVVGFDKNINHASSLYYDSGNGWTQSSIYGSIMMRPVFGTELPLSVKENPTLKTNLFSVYPNPASDQFIIQSPSQIEKATYTIINSLGQKISDGKVETFTQITTENLSTGIYFLILKVNDQLVQQQKIIIQH